MEPWKVLYEGCNKSMWVLDPSVTHCVKCQDKNKEETQ